MESFDNRFTSQVDFKNGFTPATCFCWSEARIWISKCSMSCSCFLFVQWFKMRVDICWPSLLKLAFHNSMDYKYGKQYGLLLWKTIWTTVMENNTDYCYGKQYGLLLWKTIWTTVMKREFKKTMCKTQGHKLWPWVLVHCLSAADSVVSFFYKPQLFSPNRRPSKIHFFLNCAVIESTIQNSCSNKFLSGIQSKLS